MYQMSAALTTKPINVAFPFAFLVNMPNRNIPPRPPVNKPRYLENSSQSDLMLEFAIQSANSIPAKPVIMVAIRAIFRSFRSLVCGLKC